MPPTLLDQIFAIVGQLSDDERRRLIEYLMQYQEEDSVLKRVERLERQVQTLFGNVFGGPR